MAIRKFLHVYKQNLNGNYVACTLLYLVDEQVNEKYSFPPVINGVELR